MPLSISASTAITAAASPPFMSQAPRPQTLPSLTTPSKGSRVQPLPGSTTSMWPLKCTQGPGREGSRPGPCVHFNGHIDVVEPGKGWTLEPFEGVVRDGKVWGRGACDMKGGLAAAVIAVEALIDSGIDLPGALEVSGTADEESGGYGGVAYLAERDW